MDLADYLLARGIALEELVSGIRKNIQFDPDDVLFAAGSLVEGLGNLKSDVDLYLLTSRDDIACTSLNSFALVLNGSLIDVRIVPYSQAEDLLNRFTAWSKQPRHPRRALGFSYEDRKMLHRLWSGQSLFNEETFSRFRAPLKDEEIARHKLDWSRFMASTIQIDLAGLYLAGDFPSMVFAAQDLLGLTADALLAGYGMATPNPKWRARQLGSLPDEWKKSVAVQPAEPSVLDLFLKLHRAPESMVLRDVLQHSRRIVAFSRAVFPCMEHKLLGPPTVQIPRLPALNGSGDRRGALLPCLDFDVQISYQDGRFEMWQLNESEMVFELSPLAYAMACLFDGETSKSDAIYRAASLVGQDAAEKAIEEICTMVALGHLEASARIDEEVLRGILAQTSKSYNPTCD